MDNMEDKISQQRTSINKFIEKYQEEVQKYNSELFCGIFPTPETHMEVIVGPLNFSGDPGKITADKIAQKHGVKLKDYDFNPGRWSEPREDKPVFSAILPDNEEEYEEIVTRLCQARRELYESFNRIAEFFISK